MAYTTIDDPSQYFNIVLHTGNSTDATSITGAGFQPDWVWTKCRSNTGDHFIHDSSRGVQKNLNTNDDGQEATTSQGLQSFDSDGFTMGILGGMNFNSQTYVNWLWKANGGTTASNNDGSYTSTVQANTTAGFSIVKYGDASSFSASTPATVGHGLGKAPKMVIIKNLDGTRDWGVHHAGLTDAQKIIYLNLNNAEANSSGFMNSTAPSSTVFTVNTLNVANGNNLEYIAYCFADIQGYSKFGTYQGNANAEGPFVYLGFKPKFFLLKNTSATQNWYVFDTARDTINPSNSALQVSGNSAQETGYPMDFLSNGFKIRHSDGAWNGSGNTFIYMAFAEHPFVSSEGIPVTAR